jgi:hypothetical protein
LGRLDLAANHVEEAGKETAEALKLDPGNRGAQDLNQKIDSKTGKRP